MAADTGTQAVPVPRTGAPASLPVLGFLTVIEGPTALLGRRHAIRDSDVSIGRSPDCYVAIADPSVSRLHAQLLLEGDRLVLVHRSQTNGTFVNARLVGDRVELHDGDQVQLADSVVLRLVAPAHRREGTERPQREHSLHQAMEARVELDQNIEERFVRTGSFLDVDVYDSYGLKAAESRPERVVVSFARFRSFIERQVEAHRGQILNSNGDEVMAFFESADDAVAGARAILRELPAWNDAENLLPRRFEVRTGVHTGRSAVDLQRGVAFSPVLDGAGHLQKEAAVGGLLLSDATYSALSDTSSFERAGVLTKGGIETWALAPHGAAAGPT